MTTTNELSAKLNSRYANSKVTELFNSGNMAEAQNEAAKFGMWGLWEMIGQVAGLPCDIAARDQWIANYKAARAAKFANR